MTSEHRFATAKFQNTAFGVRGKSEEGTRHTGLGGLRRAALKASVRDTASCRSGHHKHSRYTGNRALRIYYNSRPYTWEMTFERIIRRGVCSTQFRSHLFGPRQSEAALISRVSNLIRATNLPTLCTSKWRNGPWRATAM